MEIGFFSVVARFWNLPSLEAAKAGRRLPSRRILPASRRLPDRKATHLPPDSSLGWKKFHKCALDAFTKEPFLEINPI